MDSNGWGEKKCFLVNIYIFGEAKLQNGFDSLIIFFFF